MNIEEREEEWKRSKDAEVDYRIASFDIKRVVVEDAEAMVCEGLGIGD